MRSLRLVPRGRAGTLCVDRTVSEEEWRALADSIHADEAEELLGDIHNYLMDIQHRHIRCGLHILGQNPTTEEEDGYIDTFIDMHSVPDDAQKETLCETYLAGLRQTTEEMCQLLRGLEGNYIPPNIGGAVTNGGIGVLPMGRNFLWR